MYHEYKTSASHSAICVINFSYYRSVSFSIFPIWYPFREQFGTISLVTQTLISRFCLEEKKEVDYSRSSHEKVETQRHERERQC